MGPRWGVCVTGALGPRKGGRWPLARRSCGACQRTPLYTIFSASNGTTQNRALQSGKSAFVNSLVRKAALDVYTPSSTTNGPSTTPYALEVTLELDGKSVVFIDTPGLAWEPFEDADRARHHAQDVLLRNKGRIDHLKDPMPAISYIVSRAETEDLMVHYCLPAFAKNDADAFLMGVARANALIKKVGANALRTHFVPN